MGPKAKSQALINGTGSPENVEQLSDLSEDSNAIPSCGKHKSQMQGPACSYHNFPAAMVNPDSLNLTRSCSQMRQLILPNMRLTVIIIAPSTGLCDLFHLVKNYPISWQLFIFTKRAQTGSHHCSLISFRGHEPSWNSKLQVWHYVNAICTRYQTSEKRYRTIVWTRTGRRGPVRQSGSEITYHTVSNWPENPTNSHRAGGQLVLTSICGEGQLIHGDVGSDAILVDFSFE